MSWSLLKRGGAVTPTGSGSQLGQRYRAVLGQFFNAQALTRLLHSQLQDADQTRHVELNLRGNFDTETMKDVAIDRFTAELGKRIRILESIDAKVRGHPLFVGFDRSIGDNTEMIIKILAGFLDKLPAIDRGLRGLTLQNWSRQLELSFKSPARRAASFAAKALVHLAQWESQPKDESKAIELAQELDALIQELNTPGSQLEIR